jgi:hypothetical protein
MDREGISPNETTASAIVVAIAIARQREPAASRAKERYSRRQC